MKRWKARKSGISAGDYAEDGETHAPGGLEKFVQRLAAAESNSGRLPGLTKGEAANIITRLKHGAQVRRSYDEFLDSTEGDGSRHATRGVRGSWRRPLSLLRRWRKGRCARPSKSVPCPPDHTCACIAKLLYIHCNAECIIYRSASVDSLGDTACSLCSVYTAAN